MSFQQHILITIKDILTVIFIVDEQLMRYKCTEKVPLVFLITKKGNECNLFTRNTEYNPHAKEKKLVVSILFQLKKNN